MAGEQTAAFGELLKRHRLAAGLTQEELADRALISARAISDLERGVNRTPRRQTARLLAAALQLCTEEREALEAAARGKMPPPVSSEQPADDGSRVRTFMFSDLRGYTTFTREHGDQAAADLAERFADLVERTVAQWEGRVVERRGDEALSVFLSARQALRAAVELVARSEDMAQAGELPLKLGVGLDAGEAVPVKGGYRGLALNLAARLCGLAGRDDVAWGQVFASEAIVHLAGRLEGVAYIDQRPTQVKGFADPLRVFQVVRERGARTDVGRSAGPAPTAFLRQAPQKDTSASETFLIADVRGWMLFSLEHGVDAASRLADRFGEIVEDVVPTRRGRVVTMGNDDAFAVFSSAPEALRAAVELQERFAQESEVDPSLPLRVGIGLEMGGAVPFREGYVGASVDLAARLCTLAGAGEILVSETVTGAAPSGDGLAYIRRGLTELKGFTDPVQVFQVVAAADRPAQGKATVAQERPIVQPAERALPIGRFLGSLPSGSLVGRNDELGRVLAAADMVTEVEGRLVVLVGEPGAGKTRLAQEAMLILRNRDFLVATGRCYEPEQSVPYYPFLDALAETYRAAPANICADIPSRWPHVGRLLPDMVKSGTEIETVGRDEQQLLFRSMTALLEAIAEHVPVALLLDDLHWADEASLKLLLHLARHTRTSRLLLLGTYRGVEIGRDHPLQQGLLNLDREGLLERVEIGRMDEADTGALLAAIMGETDLPRQLTELVYVRTDGNPFFVQQVLRTLVERGEVYREDARWLMRQAEGAEVPESVRGVIRQRVRRLQDETQDTLRKASVLGQMFRFDDLQQLVERPEEEVEAALEEAGSAGLVREAGGDTYAFDHVLTQQALYAELSTRRRRKLHRAAAEALERLLGGHQDQRAAEVAWHFLEGEAPERALPYAILAGDQAEAVFAHAEAERQYRTALGLTRDLDDREREAEVVERLGKVPTPHPGLRVLRH